MTAIGGRQEWIIRLDSGEELRATADQRDWAALEAAGVTGSISSFRFLAWSSSHRRGIYKADWERFNTADCIEVEAVAQPGGEGEQGPGEPPAGQNPGPPDPYGVS